MLSTGPVRGQGDGWRWVGRPSLSRSYKAKQEGVGAKDVVEKIHLVHVTCALKALTMMEEVQFE